MDEKAPKTPTAPSVPTTAPGASIASPTSPPMTSTPPAAPGTTPRAGTAPTAKEKPADALRGSRASGFWAAIVGLFVVLVLLIVFIVQNTRKTTVTFLWMDGRVSVAVALLVAVAAGLFIATVAGSLRILQLRHRVRQERKAGVPVRGAKPPKKVKAKKVPKTTSATKSKDSAAKVPSGK